MWAFPGSVNVGDYKADVYRQYAANRIMLKPITKRRGFSNTVRKLQQFTVSFNRQSGFPSNTIQLRSVKIIREVEVVVDEWFYDFGRSRLRRVLRFENGRLS